MVITPGEMVIISVWLLDLPKNRVWRYRERFGKSQPVKSLTYPPLAGG